MAKLLSLALLLQIGATNALAITWEFDEPGNSQGWGARESDFSGASSASQSLLRSEVADGVWRVFLSPLATENTSSAVLISPVIGHDSALFDRISIRFRLVHSQPLQGRFIWLWTNGDRPG